MGFSPTVAENTNTTTMKLEALDKVRQATLDSQGPGTTGTELSDEEILALIQPGENADLVIAWSPVQLREAQQIIREEFKEASLILKPKELVELREQTKQLVKDEPGGFGGTTFTRSDELASNVAQQAVANRIDEMKGSEEEDPTA